MGDTTTIKAFYRREILLKTCVLHPGMGWFLGAQLDRPWSLSTAVRVLSKDEGGKGEAVRKQTEHLQTVRSAWKERMGLRQNNKRKLTWRFPEPDLI